MNIGPRVLLTGMLAAGLLWMLAVTTHAQQLPIGLVSGTDDDGEYSGRFGAELERGGVFRTRRAAGDGTDLVIVVTDADGQALPEGRSDQDLGGATAEPNSLP